MDQIGRIPPVAGRRDGREWYGLPFDDRGATATEYVGMVVVVTSIVGALTATGVGGRITERFRCAVTFGDRGGGRDTAAPRTDADHEPPLCQLSSVSDKGRGRTRWSARPTPRAPCRRPRRLRSPKGTRVSGVTITGPDTHRRTYVVRVDAAEGALPAADLDRIVESVTVR